MLNLKKLNDLLDAALESETSETLNNWIDEQIALDRAQGIIRDNELGILSMYDKSSAMSPSDKMTIKVGMSEHVSYNQGFVSDSFDCTVSNDFYLVA